MDLKLEHIGILVKNIEKSSAEYTKLGYIVTSGIIHDPVQTAYVQFLSLPGESSKLELICPDGPDSKLSNALKKGGGLNHLCYSTNDIEETCKTLREQGLFTLQTPVPAEAFPGRSIAWLMGREGIPVELVERE